MVQKPNVNSASEKELVRVEAQFDQFKEQLDSLELDRSNAHAKETAPQVLLSQEDIAKSKDIYLKPYRAIGSAEKFNEKYREDYNYAKEYTSFWLKMQNHRGINRHVDKGVSRSASRMVEDTC